MLSTPCALLIVGLFATAAPIPAPISTPVDDATLAAAVREAIEHERPDSAAARATLSARRAHLILARDVLDAVSAAGVGSAVVSASEGRVELRGRVTDAEHRARVLDAAAAVPAVLALRDHLTLESEAASAAPAAAPVATSARPAADSGRSAGAHTGPFAFLSRHGLAGRDIRLSVQDGIVDVTGIVNAPSARQHVIIAAQGVAGVRAVRAQFEIRPSEPAAELRLATLVRRRLQYDTLVQSVMPAVTVHSDRGVIRLSGLVATEAQRRRAVELASAEPVVFAVEDRLQVDPRLVLPPARR
jgi:osmotically-inducible protein OsmY